MMRQLLPLSDETARHQFLGNLPPHVRGQHAAAHAREKKWRLVPGLTGDDVRSFLMAYCACLVAATTFLF